MTTTEQIDKFQSDVRSALTYKDIMARYGCGVSSARKIVKSIRSVCGNGKLPRGKVLQSELEYWESMPIKERVRI